MFKQKNLLSSIRSLIIFLVVISSVTFADGQRRKRPSKKPVVVVTDLLPLSTKTVIETQISLPELVRRVKPSVVEIYVFDKNGEFLKLGSAFFITPTRIVTNYHVIEGGETAEIRSSEGFAYRVPRALSIDTASDLAILEVELPSGVAFKPLKISNGNLQEGEEIVVIGSPNGLQGTISQGIVSALRQNNKGFSIVQISAPISHGSSGGPVINMRGEVVGVAFAGQESGQNLNFAVPSANLASLSEKAELEAKIIRLYEDGERLYRGGNYRRALEMFSQAVRLSPNNAAAWLSIGQTQFALENFSAAITAFNETARIEPNNVEAYYLCGQAYAKQERYADALVYFQRAAIIYPNSPEIYFETGFAYLQLKDFRNAADSYKKVIGINPNDPSANFNLGLAYIGQGERKAARKQVKKLREIGASEFANELSQVIPR